MAKKTSYFDVNWVSMGPFSFSPSQLKKGKFVFDRGDGTIETMKLPFKFGKKGGGDNGKDDGQVDFGNEGPGTVVNGGGRRNNYDVDFTMKGEMRRPFNKRGMIKDLIGDPRDPNRFKMGRGIIPKNPLKASGATTMKRGGLVRGAGCAQRGRGKGKMV